MTNIIINGNDPTTQASFTLSNRFARAFWSITWALLFKYSPTPLHKWRALILRIFGCKLGRNVHVYPNVRIWAPWQLEIGNNVGIANGVTIYNMAPIIVGDYAVISQGAHLCAGSHDIDSSNFQLIAKPIILQSYVWICSEAFIGPGVSIPEGCVLAARSVLIKTITDEWTVWAGNPAVFKRVRKDNIKRH